MIKGILIENVAIIEKVYIEFSRGLNVFTGETGAGKSVIIGSISALTGARVSKDIVRTGSNKANIMGVFDELPAEVLQKINDYGYEISSEDELVIQREITMQGKSSIKIMGKPATVAILKDIMVDIVNIHGQQDNQLILSSDNQLNLLDSYSKLGSRLEEYKSRYIRYKSLNQSLIKQKLENEKLRDMEEIISFQISEIDRAGLQDGEIDQVEAEQKIVKHAAHLRENTQLAYERLQGTDTNAGATDLISECLFNINKCLRYDQKLLEIETRLQELEIELKDITQELGSYISEIEYTLEDIDLIEQRAMVIHRLKQKYGDTEQAIKAKYADLLQKRDNIDNFEDICFDLEQQVTSELNLLINMATELKDIRKDSAKKLESDLKLELSYLDMPNVCLKIEIQNIELNEKGTDRVIFNISTNLGEELKEISKIASGGEISRIMLSIKNVLSEQDIISTMIFDEVDSGVSGQAAQKIAKKLKEISSKKTQVICISHLAQIAAISDEHYLIKKSSIKSKTYTTVEKLSMTDRKYEIARIIGTDVITELTLKNAEEMITQGQKHSD